MRALLREGSSLSLRVAHHLPIFRRSAAPTGPLDGDTVGRWRDMQGNIRQRGAASWELRVSWAATRSRVDAATSPRPCGVGSGKHSGSSSAGMTSLPSSRTARVAHQRRTTSTSRPSARAVRSEVMVRSIAGGGQP